MSYQLTIEPLGATLDVADGQSMLDAALRAGIWLPYACNHGLCGTCKVTVVAGAVDHQHASAFALMDVERDEGKCLACCATLTSDVVIEAAIEEEPDALSLAVADHVGEVVQLAQLTPTIRGISVAVAGRGLAFQAGQYLNLHLPGLAQPRAFSIASAPSAPNLLELQVRQVEGGAGTGYLHRQLAPGDRLCFTAPLGRFFVRTSAPEPLLFLAGGSGLASPKSMIIERLEAGDTRPITLIHGVRDQSEIYDRALFAGLAARHSNFTYRVTLSAAHDDTDWTGARGFVHEAAERLFEGRFAGCKAYLCGPPPMVDACITTLMRGRLFEQHIFMENFFTAADAGRAPRRSALFKKF